MTVQLKSLALCSLILVLAVTPLAFAAPIIARMAEPVSVAPAQAAAPAPP